MTFARPLLLAFIAALSTTDLPAATTATTQAGTDGAASALFPQQRDIEGFTLTIHAPQVRSWTEFEHFTSTIAFSLTPSGQTAMEYGTATVAGDTVVDMDKRTVTIRSPRVTDVTFAKPVPANYTAAVMDAATRESIDVRLDLFLAQLADEVLPQTAPAGFNTSPPPILVRSTPTALLFVNGLPVPSAVSNTGLEVIVNANWPLYRDATGSGMYYLLSGDCWLTSGKLDQGWKAATTLPRGFASLPSGEEYATVRKAVPLKNCTRALPQVVFADRPTELIVTKGKPALETIPGASGLEWVTNTESPLFKLESNWYLLVAGRWFTTTNLDQGAWAYSKDLPKAFSAIPEDHARSAVRASVPGTVEAKMAALEASVPRKIRISKGSPPAVDVTYAGDPKFETIPGTQVARAVNSGFDVFLYQNRFYLCYAAGWYVGDSPIGPWAATADVPAAIYEIPPDSPSYAVTDVKVTDSSDDEIEYSSTDAYEAGVFLAYGVAYYGTGCTTRPTFTGRSITRTGDPTAMAAGTTRRRAAMARAPSGTDHTAAIRSPRATTHEPAATATLKQAGTATSGRALGKPTTRARASAPRPSVTTTRIRIASKPSAVSSAGTNGCNRSAPRTSTIERRRSSARHHRVAAAKCNGHARAAPSRANAR